jgi:hypothetical protein
LICQPLDVAILVKATILKALGGPALNSVKHFATAEVLKLAKDRTWLSKLSSAIAEIKVRMTGRLELGKERP